MKTPGRLTQIERKLRRDDTWAEKRVWRWLRNRRFSAYKFRRQHVWPGHILDVYCLEGRVNIELDGSRHGLPEHRARDLARDAELEANGIKVFRFWNSYLRDNPQSVRDTIFNTLQERAPHSLPQYCRPLV